MNFMRQKVLMLFACAILVGTLTGLVGSYLQIAITLCEHWLQTWFIWVESKGCPIGFVSALTTMILVFYAWVLVQFIAREASGSGVQEIEGALQHLRPIHWIRLLPVKFIGGGLVIAAKMVLGRGGPTIQIDGNVGDMVGAGFKLTRRWHDVLIAAGAGAGLSCAFNAPLAGVLFVLEEMRHGFHFSFVNFQVVTISCVSAVIILHLLIGNHPAIPMDVFQGVNLGDLWIFFVFGILMGFAGLLFNKSLIKSLDTIDKISFKQRIVYVMCISLLVGYLAVTLPDTVGGGYEIIKQALTMHLSVTVLWLLFIARFITSLLCYNTGVPGGIFAPMMALGTILGLGVSGICAPFLSHTSVHPGMFAVAGMSGLFSSAIRAPVTGIVLVVEMTQNYSLILPLMITCLTSSTVVQLANNPAIYTQLLHRTLKLHR